MSDPTPPLSHSGTENIRNFRISLNYPQNENNFGNGQINDSIQIVYKSIDLLCPASIIALSHQEMWQLRGTRDDGNILKQTACGSNRRK